MSIVFKYVLSQVYIMAFIIVELLDNSEDLEETRELGIIPKSWLSLEEEDRCQYPPFCKNQN